MYDVILGSSFGLPLPETLWVKRISSVKSLADSFAAKFFLEQLVKYNCISSLSVSRQSDVVTSTLEPGESVIPFTVKSGEVDPVLDDDPALDDDAALDKGCSSDVKSVIEVNPVMDADPSHGVVPTTDVDSSLGIDPILDVDPLLHVACTLCVNCAVAVEAVTGGEVIIQLDSIENVGKTAECGTTAG